MKKNISVSPEQGFVEFFLPLRLQSVIPRACDFFAAKRSALPGDGAVNRFGSPLWLVPRSLGRDDKTKTHAGKSMPQAVENQKKLVSGAVLSRRPCNAFGEFDPAKVWLRGPDARIA